MANINAFLAWVQDPFISANIGGYSVEVRIKARLPDYDNFSHEDKSQVSAALDIQGWNNLLQCDVFRRDIPVQDYIQQLIHRTGFLTEKGVFNKQDKAATELQHVCLLADAMNSTGLCYRSWSKHINVKNWPIRLDFEGKYMSEKRTYMFEKRTYV